VAGRGGTGGTAGGAGGRGGGTGGGGTGGGAVIPTNGLVGYWELDNNGNDSSGNAYNGTVTGATATTDRSGAANRALMFSGAFGGAAGTEAVTIANETPFDLTTFSITAFVRIAPSNTQRVIVAKGSTTGYGNYTFRVNPDTGNFAGYLSLVYDTASGNFSATGSSAALTQGSYIHVAVTVDATAARFYVNGAATTSAANPTPPALNNSQVTIGRCTYGAFAGAIDSVRIYNRVLTPAEIAAISAGR
jgi:hypothetical protein